MPSLPSLPSLTPLPIPVEPSALAAVPATIGINFNLPEAMPYISCVRKMTRQLLSTIGISEEETDDLETMLGELATNAARHAKGGNYRVSIEVYGDQATITVTDDGVGFDPATLLKSGTWRPDDLSEAGMERMGGFGLPLVHTLADHVSVERNQPNGMIVRVQKTVASIPKGKGGG